jgi:predicted dehydrogenase
LDQNIHVFDVCNWVLKGHPLKAVATGGRNVRSDFGDIWDNYQVNFTYPDNVHVSFNSVQFGDKLWDVTERVFGAKGVSESPYSGPIRIVGDEPWEWHDPEVPRLVEPDKANFPLPESLPTTLRTRIVRKTRPSSIA